MPKRRSPGEGSIHQIKTGARKGEWVAVLQTSGRGERRQRRVFRGKRRDIVQAKLNAEKALQPAVRHATTRETVSALVDALIAERAPRVKPRTIEQYRDVARLHIAPFIGSVLARDLSPDDVDAYLATLRRRGRSPQMQRLCRVVLFMAFKLAVRRRRIAANPLDAVEPISVPRKRMQTWTENEVRRFLAKAKGDRYVNLYVLALTCGLREGEILALEQHADVNLRDRAIYVQETLSEKTAESADPKTRGSRRRVSLPAAAFAAVKDQLERNRRDAPGSRWLFPNVDGGPFAARNLRQRHFKPLMALCVCGHAPADHENLPVGDISSVASTRCGACRCRRYRAHVPKIRFHDLRHTFATLALAAGVPVQVVSEILGHSSIKVTVDVYGHVTKGMTKHAVASIDVVFGRLMRPDATHEATRAFPVERPEKEKSLTA